MDGVVDGDVGLLVQPQPSHILLTKHSSPPALVLFESSLEGLSAEDSGVSVATEHERGILILSQVSR